MEPRSWYSGKRVVVTGASGYIGSALASALSGAGARLTLVSRRDLAPMVPGERLTANVAEAAAWEPLVQADIIFHLAGNTSVYAAESDPSGSLASTVLPLTHLLHAAMRAKACPRVVHASTVTVYGLREQFPVSEDVPAAPISIYDLHKLTAEQHLMLASSQGQLHGVSLRLANVYGPSAGLSRAADRGILDRILRVALQGQPITVFGGGEYIRDYVYIDDVVAAFLAAGAAMGESSVGRTYNVASGTGTTIRDAFGMVAEAAAGVTGRAVPLVDGPWPTTAHPIEFRSFVGDVRAMRETFSWRPTVSLAEGIRRSAQAHRTAGVA